MSLTIKPIVTLFLVVSILCGTTYGACEDGWEEVSGSCFFFEMTQMPWTDASIFCQSLGGYLAEIEDDETETQLLGLLSSHSDGNCPFAWIGGNDKCIEGQWGWSHSRKPINNFFWATGDNEPDGGSDQNVMAFTCSDSRDHGWYDTSEGASDVTAFVCQK